MSFAVFCESLTSGQTVNLFYRTNLNTTWTQFSSLTTVGAEARNIAMNEITGLQLPNNWNEIQFKIQSLAGAVITGYKFKASISTTIYG